MKRNAAGAAQTDREEPVSDPAKYDGGSADQHVKNQEKNEFLRKCMEYRNRNNRFGNLVGLTITDLDTGYAKGELAVRDELTNPIHSVHGGCLYTLADSVGGSASATYGMITPTVSSDMHFLSPAMNCGKVICEAREIKHGKRLCVYDIRITDETGKMLAVGTFTYASTGLNIEDLMAQEEKQA
ncbi:MAG: PaaI family thioesterase [Bilifractor sp.]